MLSVKLVLMQNKQQSIILSCYKFYHMIFLILLIKSLSQTLEFVKPLKLHKKKIKET